MEHPQSIINRPAWNVWLLIPALLFIFLALPGVAEELPAVNTLTTNTPSLAAPQTTSGLAMAILKVCGALAVVVGLLILTLRLLRKMGFGNTTMRNGGLIRILDTRMIAPKKYVTVLEIAGQNLALGVTDHQITLLAHLDPQPESQRESAREPKSPTSSFANLLKKATSLSHSSPKAATTDERS